MTLRSVVRAVPVPVNLDVVTAGSQAIQRQIALQPSQAEVAALAFLDRRLAFLNIAAVVADTLSRVTASGVDSGSRNACDAALAVDSLARREAESIVRGLAAAA